MGRPPLVACVAASAFVTACGALVGLDAPAAIEAPPDGAVADGTTPSEGGGDRDGSTDSPSAGDVVASDSNTDSGANCDEADLVAHWRMQEGSGTRVLDCTSGRHHGDFVGAPAWVNGRTGRKALSFNGSSGAVDFGNPTALQITGAISISVWAYVRTTTNDGRFISKGGDVGDRGWEFKVEGGDGSLELRIASTADIQTQLFAPSVPVAAWKHYVMVYAPGIDVRLYIDGTQVAISTTNIPPMQRNAGANVLIGSRTGCCTLDGMVDDMRVYKKPLKATEVTALFTAQ